MDKHCPPPTVCFAPKPRRIRSRVAWSRCLGMAILVDVMVIAQSAAAAQPASAPVYTETQAENGRALYTRSCAICHRTDLQGNFEAPPLAGTNFLNDWAERTPQALFEQIEGSMPPDRPGRLGDQAYLDIVAYLLDANGARPGSQALTATTVVPIGKVATGQVRPTPAITARAQGGRPGSTSPGDAAARPAA